METNTPPLRVPGAIRMVSPLAAAAAAARTVAYWPGTWRIAADAGAVHSTPSASPRMRRRGQWRDRPPMSSTIAAVSEAGVQDVAHETGGQEPGLDRP